MGCELGESENRLLAAVKRKELRSHRGHSGAEPSGERKGPTFGVTFASHARAELLRRQWDDEEEVVHHVVVNEYRMVRATTPLPAKPTDTKTGLACPGTRTFRTNIE
jgi:hypothetical protein